MSTPQSHQILYHLIRDFMHTLGTTRTTLVALESYIEAIHRLDCPMVEFNPMLERLNSVIQHTEPRIIPLMHLIEGFEAEMESGEVLSLADAKNRAVELLTQRLLRFQADTAKVTHHCMGCIASGELIVVHAPSAYIREALIRAKTELGRTFTVLALKQDVIRTKDLIRDLKTHGIAHLLIPESNLSHYLKSAAKLLIGAVSVTSDRQAVTVVGTANVVSLCHWYRVPVYLFVESLKFDHKALEDQHIHNEEQNQTESDFTFHMKTFSHDFIDLVMVDHLFTEGGELNALTI